MQYLLYFCITLQNPQTKRDSDKTAEVPRHALHAELGIFSAPHSHLSVTAPDKASKHKYLRQQSPSSHSCTYPTALMKWGTSCGGSFSDSCSLWVAFFISTTISAIEGPLRACCVTLFFPGVLLFLTVPKFRISGNKPSHFNITLQWSRREITVCISFANSKPITPL